MLQRPFLQSIAWQKELIILLCAMMFSNLPNGIVAWTLGKPDVDDPLVPIGSGLIFLVLLFPAILGQWPDRFGDQLRISLPLMFKVASLIAFAILTANLVEILDPWKVSYLVWLVILIMVLVSAAAFLVFGYYRSKVQIWPPERMWVCAITLGVATTLLVWLYFPWLSNKVHSVLHDTETLGFVITGEDERNLSFFENSLRDVLDTQTETQLVSRRMKDPDELSNRTTLDNWSLLSYRIFNGFDAVVWVKNHDSGTGLASGLRTVEVESQPAANSPGYEPNWVSNPITDNARVDTTAVVEYVALSKCESGSLADYEQVLNLAREWSPVVDDKLRDIMLERTGFLVCVLRAHYARPTINLEGNLLPSPRILEEKVGKKWENASGESKAILSVLYAQVLSENGMFNRIVEYVLPMERIRKYTQTPLRVEAYRLRGNAFLSSALRQGDSGGLEQSFRDAWEAFDELRKDDRESAQSYFDLGRLQLLYTHITDEEFPGDGTRASERLEDALERSNKDTCQPQLRILAWLRVAYLREGDLAKSESIRSKHDTHQKSGPCLSRQDGSNSDNAGYPMDVEDTVLVTDQITLPLRFLLPDIGGQYRVNVMPEKSLGGIPVISALLHRQDQVDAASQIHLSPIYSATLDLNPLHNEDVRFEPFWSAGTLMASKGNYWYLVEKDNQPVPGLAYPLRLLAKTQLDVASIPSDTTVIEPGKHITISAQVVDTFLSSDPPYQLQDPAILKRLRFCVEFDLPRNADPITMTMSSDMGLYVATVDPLELSGGSGQIAYNVFVQDVNQSSGCYDPDKRLEGFVDSTHEISSVTATPTRTSTPTATPRPTSTPRPPSSTAPVRVAMLQQPPIYQGMDNLELTQPFTPTESCAVVALFSESKLGDRVYHVRYSPSDRSDRAGGQKWRDGWVYTTSVSSPITVTMQDTPQLLVATHQKTDFYFQLPSASNAGDRSPDFSLEECSLLKAFHFERLGFGGPIYVDAEVLANDQTGPGRGWTIVNAGLRLASELEDIEPPGQ